MKTIGGFVGIFTTIMALLFSLSVSGFETCYAGKKSCPLSIIGPSTFITSPDCQVDIKAPLYCESGKTLIQFKMTKGEVHEGYQFLTTDYRIRLPKSNVADAILLPELLKRGDCYLGADRLSSSNKIEINRGNIQILHIVGAAKKFGSPLRCFDSFGNEYFLGLVKTGLGNQVYIPYLKSLPNSLNETSVNYSSKNDELLSKCAELERCQSLIKGGTKQLIFDWSKILYTFGGDLNGRGEIGASEVESLISAIEDALSSCNRERVKLKFNSDRNLSNDDEYGAVSKTWQGAGDFFLNLLSDEKRESIISDSVSDKAVVVRVISENLSQSEIKAIAQNVAKSVDPKRVLRNIVDIYRESYEQFARAAIDKILTKKGMTDGAKPEALNYIFADFKVCLVKGKTENSLKECLAKFEKSAPLKVGERLLIDIFEQNIKKEFAAKDVERVKTEMIKSYYSCITSWYATESRKQNDDLKACVYSGVFKGVELAANSKLNQAIEEKIPDKDARPKIFKEALLGVKCKYSKMVKGERRTGGIFKDLSLLSTDEFKAEIDSCVESVTKNGGSEIIRFSIMNNTGVKGAVPLQEEREKLAAKILASSYERCLSSMKKSGKKIDPAECETTIIGDTVLTLFEQTVAQKAKDLYSNDPQKVSSTVLSVTASMRDCKKRAQMDQKEKTMVECLAKGSGELAYLITPDTVRDQLKKDSKLKRYLIDWDKVDLPDSLSSFARSCFEGGLSKMAKPEKIGEVSETVSTHCSFEIKKQVLPEVLKRVGEYALKPNLPPEKVDELLITFFNPPSRLLSDIAKAKNEKELTSVLDRFTEELSADAVTTSIKHNLDTLFPAIDPKNKDFREQIAAKYLSNDFILQIKRSVTEGKFDSELNIVKKDLTYQMGTGVLRSEVQNQLFFKSEQERVFIELEKGLVNCLKERESSVCQVELKESGYLNIGLAKMREELLAYLESPLLEKELQKREKSLRGCFGGYKGELLETHLKGCLAFEIIDLAHEIGTLAVKKYQKLIGSDFVAKELESKFVTCLSKEGALLVDKAATEFPSRHSSISMGSLGLDHVMERVSYCAKPFEGSILASIKKKLLNETLKNYGKDFEAEISDAIDLALNLRGKSDKPSSSDELESQLLALTGKVVEACRQSKERCKEAIAISKSDIEKFQKSHPIVSAEEIMQAFYRSDLTLLIVQATVTGTLNKELESGLKARKDRYGFLERALARIADPKNSERLFKDEDGQELLNLIATRVRLEGAEAVAKDSMIKEQIILHFLMDDGVDGFVDSLIDGLVSPKLKESIDHPAIKVRIGTLFGIVKERNFDWQKIRETKNGKDAARYFRDKILLPSMNNTKLPEKEFEKRIREFEKMITKAITSMS